MPLRAAVLLLIAALCAGCGETKPSRFYSLSPVQPPAAAAPRDTASDISLGVGPIELPKYLDRLPIVSFASANRVDISEFDRWAEPLSDNFARTLAENLSVMVPSKKIDVYPFMANTPRSFERQVLVDVSQFRVMADNQIELRANWRVVDPEHRRTVADGAFAKFEPVAGSGVEAAVTAMSRALGALSQDIADAIKRQPMGR